MEIPFQIKRHKSDTLSTAPDLIPIVTVAMFSVAAAATYHYANGTIIKVMVVVVMWCAVKAVCCSLLFILATTGSRLL